MIKINPKKNDLTPEQRKEHKEKKRLKEKYADLDLMSLLKYIEALEKRIEELEKKVK